MDTLNCMANSSTVQEFAVILQGVMLVIGAILHLIKGRR